MALNYEKALQQIEAKDGQEVFAAFRKWVASEKTLVEYQQVKNKASQNVVKAYRIAKNIKVAAVKIEPVKIKTEKL